MAAKDFQGMGITGSSLPTQECYSNIRQSIIFSTCVSAQQAMPFCFQEAQKIKQPEKRVELLLISINLPLKPAIGA